MRGSGTEGHRALLRAVLSTALRTWPARCPSTAGFVETTGRLMQKPAGGFLFLFIMLFFELGPLLRDLVGDGTVLVFLTWIGKGSEWEGSRRTLPWGIWSMYTMFTVLSVSEALGNLIIDRQLGVQLWITQSNSNSRPC